MGATPHQLQDTLLLTRVNACRRQLDCSKTGCTSVCRLVLPKLSSYLCQSLPRPPCVLPPASAAALVQPAGTGSAPHTMQHLQTTERVRSRPCRYTPGAPCKLWCRSSACKLPASSGMRCCHAGGPGTYRHTAPCCPAYLFGRSGHCPCHPLRTANIRQHVVTQVSPARCQATPANAVMCFIPCVLYSLHP